MAIRRLVSCDFWTDNKVVDMFSPEDKYFMLYLLTNPHSSPLGIYQLSPRMAAFETGYSTEAIKVLLDRFDSKYKVIKWDSETQEVAIKNYLKHSVITGGKPVKDMLEKEISKVKNKELISWVFGCLKDSQTINATIKDIITNYSIDSNRDRDRDSVSYHDSSHDSSTLIKKAYAEKVTMTEKEYNTLLGLMGERLTKNYIEDLNNYKCSKGKRYVSDYHAIRSWYNKDLKSGKIKQQTPRYQPVVIQENEGASQEFLDGLLSELEDK